MRYFNFDYAQNTSYVGSKSTTADWYGLAAAAKWQLGKHALTPRLEFFNDRNGYETGTAQTLKEFTFTYEYRWVEGLLFPP